jgi:hypothetical protein
MPRVSVKFGSADPTANPPINDSDWFRKDNDPALRDWHGAAAEKEQPQVDPQGAAR